MIKRFRHKGLDRFFTTGDIRGIPSQHSKRLGRMLLMLKDSKTPQGMNVPGYGLHALKGELKGFWAVSVSGNWRLVFRFENDDATDVDFVDYH